MPDIKSIILNTPAEALEDLLSPFIEEQFPSFMRSEYRKLVLFIKAYYEWSEQEGNPGFINSKLDTIMDVDSNLQEFYSHFKSMYMEGFPENLAITTDADTPNKQTLIKKIKNFYGTKGTESAYRFLFRILYDSSVQFYYPKNHILRASDGKWIEELSVKVTRTNEDSHYALVGGSIQQYDFQNTVTAYADVERVYQYYQNGVPVSELFLVNLVGVFNPNTEVTLIPPSGTGIESFTEITFSVLGEFFVQTAGENYLVGDVVYVVSDGVGFVASVEQTGLAGAVKKIKIENSGVNYFSSVSGVVVSSNGVNANAKILFNPTAVTRYPGYYKGNTGKISSTQKIYDGEEYQEYSYKLKSAVSIDRYYSVLRELVHPAGMKMLGSVLLENALSSTASGSSQVTRVGMPVIGNYTPYNMGTTLDLRANGITQGTWFVNMGGVTYGTTGDLYPIGYNPYIGGTAELGPNGKTAPAGTSFSAGGSGGKLGFTYCFVLEGGRTAHNPLGGALGGVTAWLNNKESILTPDMVGFSPLQLVGLTLWLKPENIGVCGGSMTTGRSMDVWLDASASQNHALPPKWDSWNPARMFCKVKDTNSLQAQGVWSSSVVDNVEWRIGSYGQPVSGISTAISNLAIGGFWTGGSDVTSPSSLRFSFPYAWYNYTNSAGTPSSYVQEGETTISVLSPSPSAPTTNTVYGISYNASAATMTYYRDGIVHRTVTGVPATSYYFGFTPYSNITPSTVEVLKASYGGVPISVFSGWTCNAGATFSAVEGVTIDKLRPTLVVADRGIPGRTGIQFNGGVVYGPHTVWTQAGVCGGYVGVTLGEIRRVPLVSGYTGEKIQSGQHFTLTRGITLTKDMTVFVAFRAGSTAAGYTQSNHGLGLVSSSKRLADFSPSVERSRTNLLTSPNNMNSGAWFAYKSSQDGGGPLSVTPVVTPGVPAPNGTTTANRVAFNLGGGTSTNEYSLMIINPNYSAGYNSVPTTSTVWMRSTTGTANVLIRANGSMAYQICSLTTTWQKFYQLGTINSSVNYSIGLRGGYGASNTATVDIWNPEHFYGTGLTPFDSETDHLLYHRSYSDIDADAAKQTLTYYPVNSSSNTSFYPYESGLVGLRNNVGSTANSRIAYDPHESTLSGISAQDISLGEWRRQTDNRIRSFYDGVESKNYSVSTARRIIRPDVPGGSSPLNYPSSEVVYNTAPLSIGRFGAYCLPVLDAPYSDSTASSSFVASALLNPSYSFRGVIYEVIVYDRVLTETERQIVYSYLSRKYRMDTILPNGYVSSHPSGQISASASDYSYWRISKHPNTAQSSKILSGVSMGSISIEDFIGLYGFLYRSAGTRLSDGSVLTEDKYTQLGK